MKRKNWAIRLEPKVSHHVDLALPESAMVKINLVPIIYAQEVKQSSKRKMHILTLLQQCASDAFPSTCWLIPPCSIKVGEFYSLSRCNKTLSVSASQFEIAALRFPDLEKKKLLPFSWRELRQIKWSRTWICDCLDLSLNTSMQYHDVY